MIRQPPRSTLFPSTTLFRSSGFASKTAAPKVSPPSPSESDSGHTRRGNSTRGGRKHERRGTFPPRCAARQPECLLRLLLGFPCGRRQRRRPPVNPAGLGGGGALDVCRPALWPPGAG